MVDRSPPLKDIKTNAINPNIGTNLESPIGNARTQTFTTLSQAYEAQQISPFFSLIPAEVRNEIYEYLLLSPNIIDHVGPPAISSPSNFPHYVRFKLHIDATVLRTCRAICYEGYPVLYGRNLFSFLSPGDMTNFNLGGLVPVFGTGISPTTPIVGGLTSHADYATGRTKFFGLNPIAGSEGRFSLVRRLKLDMAMTFYYTSPGLTTLAACWKEVVQRDHHELSLSLDTLPLLECLPRLEYLYLDFSRLNTLDDKKSHEVRYLACSN